MALLYLKDADFAAVLAKAESLRADYDVTVLPQAKKLGKQFGTLEAAGYNAVAFADNDDVKLLGRRPNNQPKICGMCRKYGTSHFLYLLCNTQGAFSVLYW